MTEVAELLHLGEQTVRDYVCAFIRKGVDSLSYKRPSGRPPKSARPNVRRLANLISAGPEAAGLNTSARLSTVMIRDLILERFGVEYHPHYLCELLDALGFSFQKARFVSDHLDEVARQLWLQRPGPRFGVWRKRRTL